MKTRLVPWCFSSLAAYGVPALAVLGFFALAAPRAEAQCLPGSAFCAQVSIGGSVSVGGYIDVAPPPPPPPVIIAQPPPPPVVIYQPAPPPPPPQVFYQQPMYPPQPQMYMQPPMMQPPMMQRDQRFGLHLEVGYMGLDNTAMGGAGVGLRFRPGPHVAFELGLGAYGGEANNGHGSDSRVEVPLTVDALFFVNPRDMAQVYGLVGLGTSWANVDRAGVFGGVDYTYFGGQLGIGVELRVAPWVAFNLDLRGFVRTRIDGGNVPEFTDSTGRTTNTSGGIYGTLGATLYF